MVRVRPPLYASRLSKSTLTGCDAEVFFEAFELALATIDQAGQIDRRPNFSAVPTGEDLRRDSSQRLARRGPLMLARSRKDLGHRGLNVVIGAAVVTALGGDGHQPTQAPGVAPRPGQDPSDAVGALLQAQAGGELVAPDALTGGGQEDVKQRSRRWG